MANIPIPDIPGGSGTPYQAARMDADAAMAPARGMMALGQSLEQNAKALGEIAYEAVNVVGSKIAGKDYIARFARATRAAQERKAIDDLEIAKDALQKDYARWQEINTDETKWLGEWQDRTAKLEDVVGAAKVLPEIKDRLMEHVRTWTALQDTAVNNQAYRYSNAEAKKSFETNLQIQVERGNFEEAMAMVDTGVAVGYHSKTDALVMVQKLHKIQDTSEIQRLINDNPMAATEALEAKRSDGKWEQFRKISEGERLAFVNQARIQTNNLRGEAFQEYTESIDGFRSGDGPMVDESMIDSDVRLRPTDKVRLKKFLAQGTTSGDSVQMGAILDAADAWTPEAGNVQFAEIMAQAKAYGTEFTSEINQRLDAGKNPDNQIRLASTTRAYIDSLFEIGAMGDWKTYAKQNVYRVKTEEPSWLREFATLGFADPFPVMEDYTTEEGTTKRRAVIEVDPELEKKAKEVYDEAWRKKVQAGRAVWAFIRANAEKGKRTSEEEQQAFLRSLLGVDADVKTLDITSQAIQKAK